MRTRQGFTLIELSIVVFIVAIVLAVSAPSFIRSYNSTLLKETARTFATTCQLARMQAVVHQQPAILHADLDRQAFWVTQSLKTEDGDRNDQTIKTHSLSPRVVMVSVGRTDFPDQAEKTIDGMFYPNGTCDPIGVVFRGTEPGGLAALVDPITGKVTVTVVK